MNIEERYFHRQTLILGEQTQAKVRRLRVCVCRLSLLGLEIAKNLIMMGVGKVIIFDSTLVKQEDSLNSFYFCLDDVGERKAKASLRKFRQLGAFTEMVQAASNHVEMISSQADVAVVADCWDEDFTHALNQQMHSKNKGFVLTFNLALYGSIFVDFGDKHEITDCTGQKIQKRYINMISNEKQAYISFANGDNRFQIGDDIYIYCIKGMTEANGQICKIVKKDSQGCFIDLNSTNFSTYRSGGIAELFSKKGETVGFTTLADNVKKTIQTLNALQLDKLDNFVFEPTKHLNIKSFAVLSIFSQFYKEKHKLPGNQQDQELLRWISNNLLESFPVNSQDKLSIYNFIFKLSHFSRLQISPFATLWGGIAAQEVIKFTGKYTPINQWLHYDELDMIVQSAQQLSKYSQLFGNHFEENSSNANVALVGGGALGSEILKIISQLGLGTTGTITVLDDDILNEQNVNRMCLTNKEDLGKKKGALLAEKSLHINKNMNISFVDEKVIKKGENKSQFWKKQNIIISAVDTFRSRQILDGISTSYKKVMINGGSEDLKASTQVIIPYLSQNYCASVDIEGQHIYMPKSNHFPYKASQVIQMAIGRLDKYLEISNDILQLAINKKQFITSALMYHKERSEQPKINQKFEDMLEYYQIYQSKQYSRCVQLALSKFYLEFQKSTKELLQSFPEDRLYEGTQTFFWSGLKHCPKIIDLDLNDPAHIKYVHSLSTIFAEILSVPSQNQSATIKIAKEVQQIAYERCFRQKISDPNKIMDINTILNKKMEWVQFKMCQVISFDRTHPKQSHFQFLQSTSTLISRKFQIEEASREEVEKTVCRLAPTVITGISITAGLLTLELIKVLKGGNDSCKNNFANLALPRLVQSSLAAPKLINDKAYDPIIMGQVKCIPQVYSNWQSLSIVGPMTLLQLKQHYQHRLRININVIYTEQKMIYGQFSRRSHYTLDLEVSQALKQMKTSNCEQNPLQIWISEEYYEGQTQSNIPPINYYLHK